MPDVYFEKIVHSFPFEIDSVIPLQRSDDLSLYRVSGEPGLYIVDAPEGRRIATDPSIVGEEFDALNKALSQKICRIFKELNIINENVIFEHVLRAAPGYRLREAVKKELSPEIRDFYIRPRYIQTSYRHHIQNDVETVFAGSIDLNESEVYTLVKPDTEATGRSSIRAIEEIISRCEIVGARIDRAILYGFISLSGYRRISKFAQKRKFELIAFAIEDVTPLASNGYDMPLYGIDEGIKLSTGQSVMLAAIAPKAALEKMLLTYYPGMDQPGDWSERQLLLFNGITYERGDMPGHLAKSLARLDALQLINKDEQWYSSKLDDTYFKIRNRLLAALENLGVDEKMLQKPD